MPNDLSLISLSPAALALGLTLALGGCNGAEQGDSEDVVFSGATSDSTTAASTTDATTGDTDTTGDATTDTTGESASGSTGTTEEPTTTAASTTDDTDGGCTPGASQSCYSGPQGTEGVGACASGTQTCDDDGTWGSCEGDVVPSTEICGNDVDDDCNGAVDDDVDNDGDGWTTCGGDCCDVAGGTCLDPELVNPGAYEYVGNDVDDNCNGVIDEAAQTCDDGLASNSASPLDYAKAMDLCQFTTESPSDPEDRIWGVISAKLSLANGGGSPQAVQRAIRQSFGNAIAKQAGKNMAIFSSGHAAATGDTTPDYAGF